MKVLEIPRTVIDTKYESFDGQVFDKEEQCKTHENILNFNSFTFDDSKTFGPLTEENWKHYVYKFLHTFTENPVANAHLMSEDNYHEHTWKKNERVDLGFKLLSVKQMFITAYNEMPGYNDRFEKERYNNGYGYRAITRFYKEDFTYFALYKFMFESGLLNRVDILRKDEKENKNFFNKNIFDICFFEDSIEALEIVIKHLGLDLYDALTYQYVTSRGGGSKNTNTDFITKLLTKTFSRNNYKEIDDFKRLKWLTYLLEKDLPIQLYRFYPSEFFHGNFEELVKSKEKLIYFPISQLIDEVKDLKDKPTIYLFKKNHTRIIELLETKCGPNFKKANENNSMPKFFELAFEACSIVKEIFAKYPDIKIEEDEDVYFVIKRIIEENMPTSTKDSNYYRHAKEIKISCKIDTFGDKENVFIVDLIERAGWANDNNATKKRIQLKDFLGKPDLLALEMVYYLNAEMPLGPTAHERVKEIDIKLFELQKQKELLAKEEEALKSLKKTTSIKK